MKNFTLKLDDETREIVAKMQERNTNVSGVMRNLLRFYAGNGYGLPDHNTTQTEEIRQIVEKYSDRIIATVEAVR